MQRLKQIFRRLNPNRSRQQADFGMATVGDWETRYGRPAPKILALFSLSGGGSHFVLHQLHGHPNLLALKERALYFELKNYFRHKQYFLQSIYEDQLLPRQTDFSALDWIAINKPVVDYVAQHYLHNRERMRLVYLLRNPVASLLSRYPGSARVSQSIYGRELDIMDFAAWLNQTLLVSLAGFAQIYDPQRDLVLNLESFTCHPLAQVNHIASQLGMPPVRQDQMAKLTHCDDCGAELEVKSLPAGKRQQIQDLLYCSRCQKAYLGAGGYNYIREVDTTYLSKWKQNQDAARLRDFFAQHLDEDLMAYFEDEAYLQPDSHDTFKRLFDRLIARYQAPAG